MADGGWRMEAGVMGRVGVGNTGAAPAVGGFHLAHDADHAGRAQPFKGRAGQRGPALRTFLCCAHVLLGARTACPRVDGPEHGRGQTASMSAVRWRSSFSLFRVVIARHVGHAKA